MNNYTYANDLLYKILCVHYSLLSFCCLLVFLDRREAFRMSEESEVVSSAKHRLVHAKMARPKHPKYTEMVEEAIKFFNEKGGSSRQAILKYITVKYLVGENAKNQVKLALVKSVGKGRLVQTKGVGASGSFKLSKEVKEEAKKEEKKRLKMEEKKALKDKENTAPESDGKAKKSATKKVKKRAKNDSEEKETKKTKKAATKKTKPNKETASKVEKESKSKEKKSKAKAKTEETVKEKKKKKPSAKTKTSKIK